MEQFAFTRVTISALCCLASGIALIVLAAVGVVPIEVSVFGITSLLGSIGLLAWVGIQLWGAMHGETVSYRLLYHADHQPDGKAIARTLDALARSAGHVSLIWHFHSCTSPDMAAFSSREHAAHVSEEGQVGERTATPAMHSTPPSPNISLFIMMPATARKALDGMIPGLLPGVWAENCKGPDPLMPPSFGWGARAWRWDTAASGDGSLADPLASGVHLSELTAGLTALIGSQRRVGELEIRLKLWAQGKSATVSAQCSMAQPVLPPTTITSPGQGNSLDGSPQVSSHESPLPFLKPLLTGWSWWWPEPQRQEHPIEGKHAVEQNRHIPRFSRQRGARSPVPAGLAGVLVGALAANYPLWQRPRVAFPHHVSKLRRRANDEAAGSDPVRSQDDPVSTGLLFPTTIGPYSSLDSIQAGEVPPPPSYQLPPVPAQVLVIGSATGAGRFVGVPALRRPVELHCNGSSPGTPGAAGSTSPHKRMRLHPMLAEHLLVAGGSDAWRRDVAGSLVSQALEMGMTVVAIDGGAPPDEPPPSTRKRSRIVSGELRYRSSGSSSAGNADPLSPALLRSGDPGLVAKRIAQIDMDNPAGSVRPNILYVPAASWLPPMEGEALAISLALQVGLTSQMSFLQAVNVTGIDAGISRLDVASVADGGPGMAIVQAWLTVLLLRHHRARLLLASRGVGLPPEVPAQPESIPGVARSAPAIAHVLPTCPDLPSLLVVLEQSETLLSLLHRERDAWGDRDWIRLVESKGGSAGERALQTAHKALEGVAFVGDMDAGDLFLYGAALRGQLRRVLDHSAMIRMLSRPHVSLADILQGGAFRMLRVNLSGAYRTAAPPDSEDDLVRKHYGLYLLWSLWAMSRQREALNLYSSENNIQGNIEYAEHTSYSAYTEPNPVLLMLHGAGAWFGSGSPLSKPSTLQELGSDRSGIALATTVSGLRHLRAYRASACSEFGNLVIGPAPVADLDAPEVTLNLVDAELRLLRDGMHRVAARVAPDAARTATSSPGDDTSHPDMAWQAPNGDRLLGVLRRIEEGTALVVTNLPGGRKAVCTAQVGSGVASDVRNIWSSPISAPAVPPGIALFVEKVQSDHDEWDSDAPSQEQDETQSILL